MTARYAAGNSAEFGRRRADICERDRFGRIETKCEAIEAESRVIHQRWSDNTRPADFQKPIYTRCRARKRER